MRSAVIAPYASGPIRGNIVTIRRVEHYLRTRGIATTVLSADLLSSLEMERRLVDFSPDLIHAFHACHCGPIARHLAERLQVPYLITLTGSDIHDPSLRDHHDTVRSLRSADALVCFSPLDAALVTGCFPDLNERVAVVPQGVEPLPFHCVETFGLAPDDFVVLLPAVLRPVKGVDFALQAVAPLVQTIPELRLVIAGGVIDEEYAATVRTLLSAIPSAVWLGEVPRERMGGLYRRADLVINCSRSESMPNSLLEAMALGRPVLASDIYGNRSLVHDGTTGWLYTDEADFRRQLLLIRENNSLRSRCGAQARDHVLTTCSPLREADRYTALYERIRGAKGKIARFTP